jgi:hypothetical protein
MGHYDDFYEARDQERAERVAKVRAPLLLSVTQATAEAVEVLQDIIPGCSKAGARRLLAALTRVREAEARVVAFDDRR